MTCSSTHFAVFRIALGLFLVTHFLWLVPFAGEIYGPFGMYPREVQAPFPSFLNWCRSTVQVQVAMIGLAALAGLFAMGFARRCNSVILWYGWACLTNRVPFLYVPSEGLVGWMLLLCAVIPGGESRSIWPPVRSDWRMPKGAIRATWVVLGIGYLASGIDKLSSPSWVNGAAVRTVLSSPVAYWKSIAYLAGQLPDGLAHGISWSVLAIETSFFFFSWSRRMRPVAWGAATAMHLCIRATLSLHTVTDPFLIAHLLIFDPRWLVRRERRQSNSSADFRVEN